MRATTRRPATHAEDEYHMQDSFHIAEEGTNVCAHTEWRDAESARLTTERLLRIAKRTRRRVHVLHITTAGKVTFLATHKDVATVECTPQHLTLNSPGLYDRLRPFAKINSPVRDAHHRSKLWTCLQSGVVDVIEFGHAPHTREVNPRTHPNTPSGLPGVQTLVSVMLNNVH
jgi:dihydroorotase